jgi:hypothetical protein
MPHTKFISVFRSAGQLHYLLLIKERERKKERKRERMNERSLLFKHC